jgi:GNAT superfamily N-acetyltransferase
MSGDRQVDLRWAAHPDAVDLPLLDQIVGCWWEVANAGGAVGFPFPPVARSAVEVAAGRMVASLNPSSQMLLVAVDEGVLDGWLLLERNENPLTAHWARISRVQTTLAARGRGIGHAMMDEVVRMATELSLEQLHLELRAGQGLEGFYEFCGWSEVGRWPSALRLRPGDDRDEVLMMRRLDVRSRG